MVKTCLQHRKLKHKKIDCMAFISLLSISSSSFTSQTLCLKFSGFSLLGMIEGGGGGSRGSPLAENLLIVINQGKSSHQRFIPLTKLQFLCYNPIKMPYFVAVVAPVPFLFYLHVHFCTHRQALSQKLYAASRKYIKVYTLNVKGHV